MLSFRRARSRPCQIRPSARTTSRPRTRSRALPWANGVVATGVGREDSPDLRGASAGQRERQAEAAASRAGALKRLERGAGFGGQDHAVGVQRTDAVQAARARG